MRCPDALFFVGLLVVFPFLLNATFVNDLLRLYAPQRTQAYLENLLVDLRPRLIVRRVEEMHSYSEGK